MRNGLRGRMPARYDDSLLPPEYQGAGWRYRFEMRLAEVARDGMEILDIGAGRWPTILPEDRPLDCHYVSLDSSGWELEKAEPGSYDQSIVRDLCSVDETLRGRFDLAVSWLLFEHLPDVAAGLEAVRAYLRPGGSALIFLAGRNSLSSRLNRLVPHRLARFLLGRLRGRSRDSVFPAHYDRCSYSQLVELGRDWESFEVESFFWAANYFTFSRPLLALALAHEELIVRRQRVDQAGFYLVCARA